MVRKDSQPLATKSSRTASSGECNNSSTSSPAPESKEELYSILHGPAAVALSLSHINTQGDHFGAAAVHMRKLRDDLKPRDAIEDMLIEQLAVTHARVVKLSGQAVIQKNESWYRTLSEACDRAAGTFRRLTVAFREYRDPRRTTVMAIQQANVANQQVVQHMTLAKEDSDARKKTIQANAERPAIPSGDNQPEPAVAAIDRAENNGGEKSLEPKRDEARAAIRRRQAQRTRRR
jgi:hypothetical protein